MKLHLIGALLTVCGVLSAQTPAQERKENANRTAAGLTPVYRVTVTERTAKAISYRHRSGATKIDFRGTALMPNAHGEAKVEGKQGYIEIAVEFRDLSEANQFGVEYLTYVLWAITPEGRTSNLGEILRNGTSGKLDVTTELQSFGLLVTAEPYFAVSRPSDVVVMENIVRPDTAGKIEVIDAKYELLQRGQYEHLAKVLDLRVNRKVPLEVYVSWPYWAVIGILALSQFLFLRIPVRIATKRPVSRVSIWLPVLVSGLWFGGLVLAGGVALAEGSKYMNDFNPWWCLGTAVASWIVWAVVFFLISRAAGPEESIKQQSRWLLRGSILELLIAVPSHIVARGRGNCSGCAGIFTFFGITMGISVMLLSFGPAVFLLYHARWRRLRQTR